MIDVTTFDDYTLDNAKKTATAHALSFNSDDDEYLGIDMDDLREVLRESM